jgi:hypothetical protein
LVTAADTSISRSQEKYRTAGAGDALSIFDALRIAQHGLGRRAGAERMADDDRPLDVQGIEDIVGAQGLIDTRVAEVLRPVGKSERRQIESDGAIAGIGERRHGAAPQLAPRGGPVEQHHRDAVSRTCFLHEHPTRPGLDEAAGRGRELHDVGSFPKSGCHTETRQHGGDGHQYGGHPRHDSSQSHGAQCPTAIV